MPRAIGSRCRSPWMAARETTASARRAGVRSASPTCALTPAGAESHSSSGTDEGRSSAPSAEASEASSAITKLSPASWVVGKRCATADEPRVHDLAAERELERPARARARGDVGARHDGQPAAVERLPGRSSGLLRGVDHVAQRQRRRPRGHVTPPWPPQPVSGGGLTGPPGVVAASGPRASTPAKPRAALRPSAPRAPPSVDRCPAAAPGWRPRARRAARPARGRSARARRPSGGTGGRSCAASSSRVCTTSTSWTAVPAMRTGSLSRVAVRGIAGRRARRACAVAAARELGRATARRSRCASRAGAAGRPPARRARSA